MSSHPHSDVEPPQTFRSMRPCTGRNSPNGPRHSRRCLIRLPLQNCPTTRFDCSVSRASRICQHDESTISADVLIFRATLSDSLKLIVAGTNPSAFRARAATRPARPPALPQRAYASNPSALRLPLSSTISCCHSEKSTCCTGWSTSSSPFARAA